MEDINKDLVPYTMDQEEQFNSPSPNVVWKRVHEEC